MCKKRKKGLKTGLINGICLKAKAFGDALSVQNRTEQNRTIVIERTHNLTVFAVRRQAKRSRILKTFRCDFNTHIVQSNYDILLGIDKRLFLQ